MARLVSNPYKNDGGVWAEKGPEFINVDAIVTIGVTALSKSNFVLTIELVNGKKIKKAFPSLSDATTALELWRRNVNQ